MPNDLAICLLHLKDREDGASFRRGLYGTGDQPGERWDLHTAAENCRVRIGRREELADALGCLIPHIRALRQRLEHRRLTPGCDRAVGVTRHGDQW